jgi:hypothetical protein
MHTSENYLNSIYATNVPDKKGPKGIVLHDKIPMNDELSLSF